MQPFHYTAIKALSLTVGVATLLISCSRDGDATQDGGRRELVVDVQMQNADWQTRSGGDGTSAAATVGTQIIGSAALDEQLEVVAECEPIGSALAAPLTRGSLAKSTTDLRSLSFSVYTNSVFTKTFTATNNSGSWAVADNILLDLDKNKYSYYAYAPVATVDNGLKLAGDGTTLTYIAPAEITKQPDLCRATPVSNDKTGYVTFAMQHALTAVGVKVRADNVEIQSIKLVGVNTSGALDLTSGTWTGLSGEKELTFPLTNTKPATGNGMANLTPGNGYLMLPPQPLTDDGKKLVIVYKYNGETTWRTGTHSLKTLTGGSWVAGQQVNYVIQLKAYFSLDLGKYSDVVPYSAGSYSLSYTTGSSASTTIDPQVSCPQANGGWISNLKVNRSSGKGTITFDYATHNTVKVARQTVITVTSGFTPRDFTFKQLFELWIRLSSTAYPGDVYREGTTYRVAVATPVGVAWKTTAPSNCSVSPASGAGSETVTITIPATTVDRNVSVTFSTNVGGGIEETAVWSGKQTKTPRGCSPIPLPGYPNTYVFSGDSGKYATNDAVNVCAAQAARLPSIEELRAIYNNRSNYGTFQNDWYASGSRFGWGCASIKFSSGEYFPTNTDLKYVRCVKDV